MIKTIKKVLLSSLSILGISFLFWILFLSNPKWSYAKETKFDFVTVYHNQNLEPETQQVINGALNIIKSSELFTEDVAIQLCFNDDQLYPYLFPFVGGPTAYAFFDKTVFKNCTPKFKENVAEFQWAINNNELRKFNLTWLIAHEFTHNLQYFSDPNYYLTSTLGQINWKLEGYAEYIAREFKQDGQLKAKIEYFLVEEKKEQVGLPVIDLADGTKQIFAYYKYALVVQYLIEIKNLDFHQICELEIDLEDVYSEMIDWSKK